MQEGLPPFPVRIPLFSNLCSSFLLSSLVTMKYIICALIVSLFATITVLANNNAPKDYQRSYKYWNLQVNRNAIHYENATFPCFQPNARCMGVYNPTMEYEKYEINVVGNGNVTCNQKYRTGKGELERTVYSGRCFTTGPITYLITCRNPPNDPNYSNGWVILHFKDQHTYFSSHNGGKARFVQALNNTIESNPFKNHDYSRDLFANVEAFCPLEQK